MPKGSGKKIHCLQGKHPKSGRYIRYKYTNERLKEVKGLKVIGNAENKGGVFSFNVEGIHPQDLAFILDKEGVSVRTGHHCAEPLVHRMGFESVARASLGLYSTEEDIDNFVKALNKAVTFF